MTLAGWPDAAHGDQNGEGAADWASRLVAARGPRRLVQRSCRYARKLEQSSLGGEVYAASEVMDHVAMLRRSYDPLVGLSPGEAGRGDCESFLTRLKAKRAAAGTYSARRYAGIRQALGSGELRNVYWAPGLENPGDGLAG